MKLIFAVLVTLMNTALVLYVGYYGLSLVGKVGFAYWIGTNSAAVPFLLVAVYGLKPGSRALWNWGFSLNGLLLLACIIANVVAFRSPSDSLFATWSVTIFFAFLAGLNIAFLLGFPPRLAASAATSTAENSGGPIKE